MLCHIQHNIPQAAYRVTCSTVHHWKDAVSYAAYYTNGIMVYHPEHGMPLGACCVTWALHTTGIYHREYAVSHEHRIILAYTTGGMLCHMQHIILQAQTTCSILSHIQHCILLAHTTGSMLCRMKHSIPPACRVAYIKTYHWKHAVSLAA